MTHDQNRDANVTSADTLSDDFTAEDALAFTRVPVIPIDTGTHTKPWEIADDFSAEDALAFTCVPVTPQPTWRRRILPHQDAVANTEQLVSELVAAYAALRIRSATTDAPLQHRDIRLPGHPVDAVYRDIGQWTAEAPLAFLGNAEKLTILTSAPTWHERTRLLRAQSGHASSRDVLMEILRERRTQYDLAFLTSRATPMGLEIKHGDTLAAYNVYHNAGFNPLKEAPTLMRYAREQDDKRYLSESSDVPQRA